MKIESEVTLVFKNKEGDKREIKTTFKEMLVNDIGDYYDELEVECTNSGCNNETQNFCDCGPEFEDYEASDININTEVSDIDTNTKETMYKVKIKDVDFKNLPNDEEFYFVFDLAGGNRVHRCGHIKAHPNNFTHIILDGTQI